MIQPAIAYIQVNYCLSPIYLGPAGKEPDVETMAHFQRLYVTGSSLKRNLCLFLIPCSSLNTRLKAEEWGWHGQFFSSSGLSSSLCDQMWSEPISPASKHKLTIWGGWVSQWHFVTLGLFPVILRVTKWQPHSVHTWPCRWAQAVGAGVCAGDKTQGPECQTCAPALWTFSMVPKNITGLIWLF